MKNFFQNELGPNITETTNKFVGVMKDGGNTFVNYSTQFGNDVAKGSTDFFNSSWDQTKKTADQVGSGCESVGKKIGGWFGF